MFNIPESNDAKCFERAVRRGQETFTLVEQDATAPGAILDWVRRGFDCGVADEKLRQAFETALRWRKSACAKKLPD